MTFDEYVFSAPREIQPFLIETATYLAGNGYQYEMKDSKSGPVISIIKARRVLLNFVCRKNGIRARLYLNNIAGYENKLDSLPEQMKKEIIKAADCKKLNGLTCTPTCPSGYLFHMDGTEYRKCRSLAFLFTLKAETVSYVKDLIYEEVRFSSGK